MIEPTLELSSVAELEALPDRAVVLDHDGDVLQKIGTRDQGACSGRMGRWVWFTPGVEGAFQVTDIVLPAQLLTVAP